MNRAAVIARKAMAMIKPNDVWLIFFAIAGYDLGLYAGGAAW